MSSILRYHVIIVFAAVAMLFECGEDPVSIGAPPSAPTFTINKIDDNNIIFNVTSAIGFMVNWDFGNGVLSQKKIDTMYYPFADTYTVKLTASNKGGATTTSEKLSIEKTDPKICNNRYYTLLSGGCDVVSKTWVLYDGDSTYGNGPPTPKDPDGNGTSSYNDPISHWFNSVKSTGEPPPRAMDDEYVFGLRGFTYKNDCHGDFYFNWKWTNKLYGTTQETYADTIHAYIPNNPATWKLDVDTLTPEVTDALTGKTMNRFFTDSTIGKRFNLILTLSNDNYIGYCSGTSIYQILEITPDMMYLRHELAEPDDPSITGPNRLEWRYLRLAAKK